MVIKRRRQLVSMMSSGTAGAATTEVNDAAADELRCVPTAASHKLMTSNWRNVMAVNRLAIAAICARKIIGSSTRRSVKELQPNYMIKIYSSSLKKVISESARSPICFFPLSLDMAKGYNSCTYEV